MKKQIAILGSTGSIGTQTLEVINEHPDNFEVYLLTANNNADLLISQAKKFLPDSVVIVNEKHYKYVKDSLTNFPIKVYTGKDAVCQCVKSSVVDIVVTAMVGYAGLEPTIEAIKAGKVIALANKETLVVAGELINDLAKQYNTPILPIDSEHSAIFQCLSGEFHNPVEKLIITASGGPFRTLKKEELEYVTVSEALKHPKWKMGAKITIDSASLMNKGFEVIEAKWLFGIDPSKIEVVVHPQSIVHSMVQFGDGSIKAQLGMPDMKVPIAYALSYPNRMESRINQRLSISDYSSLTFEKPDLIKFPNLQLAYDAMKSGGNRPCILNAANEIVVDAFLNGKCRFMQMPLIIEETLAKISMIRQPSYEDYVATDKETRELAKSLLK
ncbi:MAG: 1-deoxy-D-xylulose-5-phosphate reductoisomerase [Bacteroidales bacterium]|nr:1-deoxy-D-xylulose-5-phosphate reductoisomerase [Bacteroidales bacterium]